MGRKDLPASKASALTKNANRQNIREFKRGIRHLARLGTVSEGTKFQL
jgi:hypothetical protein